MASRITCQSAHGPITSSYFKTIASMNSYQPSQGWFGFVRKHCSFLIYFSQVVDSTFSLLCVWLMFTLSDASRSFIDLCFCWDPLSQSWPSVCVGHRRTASDINKAWMILSSGSLGHLFVGQWKSRCPRHWWWVYAIFPNLTVRLRLNLNRRKKFDILVLNSYHTYDHYTKTVLNAKWTVSQNECVV